MCDYIYIYMIIYIYMCVCVVIEIVHALVLETHARCPLRWKIPGSLAHKHGNLSETNNNQVPVGYVHIIFGIHTQSLGKALELCCSGSKNEQQSGLIEK